MWPALFHNPVLSRRRRIALVWAAHLYSTEADEIYGRRATDDELEYADYLSELADDVYADATAGLGAGEDVALWREAMIIYRGQP